MTTKFIEERKFDSATCRHYKNDTTTVLHCHHYMTLYTQLAEDAGDLFDGNQILFRTSEETFYPILKKYYTEHQIEKVEDRINIAQEYWTSSGMGKLVFTEITEEGGVAEMPFSHLDAGWIKKWGHHDKPVNFIGCGYLAGAFSSIFNLPLGSYEVTETHSIAANHEKSRFEIKQK